jgi:HAD superfamily hydrolase (TIGR01509 family)
MTGDFACLPLRAVVFDLDGLMFNTETLYRRVGSELLRRRGKQADEALFSAMMGRPPRVSLQIMIDRHRLDATLAELARESEELFGPVLEAHLAAMPGLFDLLAELERAGIPKAIATSSPRTFLNRVLARFDLARRFVFALTSEDVARGKPHPDVYLAASGRFSLPPARVMVLEDSEAGCRAAVAAGTFAVAVPGEHSRGHDFTGAALIAESLSDPRIRQALAARSIAQVPPNAVNPQQPVEKGD